MTVTELMEEVSILGFENSLENERAFLISANRALRLIFSERGISSSLKMIQNNPLPVFHLERYSHRAGDERTFSLGGMAISFKVCGEGSFRIDDGKKITEEKFNTPMGVIRKFIGGSAEITFLGALGYEVLDLCSFETLKSAEEKNIPVYSTLSSHDLSIYKNDILTLCGEPEDDTGGKIDRASYRGNLLILPYSFDGEVAVFYKRAPKAITLSDENEEVDIPSDCRHLLPLLTAAYLWLDDDEEKAQYYMQLYREAMALLKRYSPENRDTKFNDVLGWC